VNQYESADSAAQVNRRSPATMPDSFFALIGLATLDYGKGRLLMATA
jgi:hypothetical protein